MADDPQTTQDAAFGFSVAGFILGATMLRQPSDAARSQPKMRARLFRMPGIHLAIFSPAPLRPLVSPNRHCRAQRQ